MVVCCVQNCKSAKGRPSGQGKTFHVFPRRDSALYLKWIEKVGKSEWLNDTKYRVVCSNHFEATDFDRTGQTVRLKNGSIPKLLLADQELDKEQRTSMQNQNVDYENVTHQVINSEQIESIQLDHDYISGDNVQQSSESINCITTENSPTAGPSNTSRKRKLIDREHCYAIGESPRKLKRKLLKEIEKTKKVAKRVKMAKQKLRRLQKKVKSLTEIIRTLKKDLYVSHNAADILEQHFSGIPLELIQRILHNKEKLRRDKYPPQLRSFALTLQFYSSKAYNYVRETFGLALPHPATIRQWYSTVDGKPGFTHEGFVALKKMVTREKAEGRNVICSLMLDEMSIKKAIEFDGKQFYGYVDMGTEMCHEDLPVASEALVFMVVCLNKNWKVPVAYFLINSMTGEERANLILLCLSKLNEVGVKIISITCDGPSCHLSMLKTLGASMDLDNPKPMFMHPDIEHRINVILDICHMLKLIRNAWEFLKCFKNGKGELIDYKYILLLHELQEATGLRAGNKLTKKHIEFKKQIMKVNLAAQTLSRSVADALEFCMKDLQLPQFQGAAATIEFIKIIDRLFDIGNSRNPIAMGTKGPLRIETMDIWLPFINYSLKYLKELTDVSGTPLYKTPRKTGFIGFYLSTLSFVNIFNDYINCDKPQLSYLLTYKMSQDHLELFFGGIRAHGRWSNNPSAQHFMHAYKKLLLRHEVKCNSGNVSEQDETSILFVTKNKICISKNDKKEVDIADIALNRRYGLSEEEMNMEDVEHVNFVKLDSFLVNTVTYISGYCIKMVRRNIKCYDCLNALVETDFVEDKDYDLITRKNRGGLIIPSKGVVEVCKITEKLIRRTKQQNDEEIPRDPLYVDCVKSCVLGTLGKNDIFPSLKNHHFDVSLDVENHVFRLIKEIAGSYLKIRIHHEASRKMEKIHKNLIRKKLSRLVIFNNQ